MILSAAEFLGISTTPSRLMYKTERKPLACIFTMAGQTRMAHAEVQGRLAVESDVMRTFDASILEET